MWSITTYFGSGTALGTKDLGVSVFRGLGFPLEPLHLKGEETEARGSEVMELGHLMCSFCNWAGSTAQVPTDSPDLLPYVQSHRLGKLFLLFSPLKLPVNSQLQKNVVFNDCKGPRAFRGRMQSLFCIGFISPYILLIALVFARQLINKRSDAEVPADKITENLLSTRGDAITPWVPSFKLDSLVPFSLVCCQALENCYTFTGFVSWLMLVSMVRGGPRRGRAPSTNGNEIPQCRYQLLSPLIRNPKRPLPKHESNRK